MLSPVLGTGSMRDLDNELAGFYVSFGGTCVWSSSKTMSCPKHPVRIPLSGGRKAETFLSANPSRAVSRTFYVLRH